MFDKRFQINLKFSFLYLKLIILSLFLLLIFQIIINYKPSFNQSFTIIELNSLKKKLNYEILHNNIVFNNSSKFRVVFYKDSKRAGYCNSLYSLMTAFMLAIVTESALLIDWPEIKNYIQEPLKLSFYKFNDSSPLDFNQKYPEINHFNTVSINSWNFSKHLIGNEIGQTILENITRYYVSDIISYFFDLCQNRAYAEKLVQYGYVRNRTFSKAFDLLNDEESLDSQKIDYIFYIGFEFAGNFLNKHWTPKENLNIKLNNFIKKKIKHSWFIIGKIKFIITEN